ncbi:MAG: ArsR/SmtB family transcription factor [Caulobacterales bacterium]
MTACALDRTLAALADPTRRRIVDLLRERPHAAGEMASKLNVTAPIVSRHLKTLRQTGLVADAHPDFDARVRIYSLRREPIAEVRAWLEATEALWADELAAFKAHIERPGHD